MLFSRRDRRARVPDASILRPTDRMFVNPFRRRQGTFRHQRVSDWRGRRGRRQRTRSGPGPRSFALPMGPKTTRLLWPCRGRQQSGTIITPAASPPHRASEREAELAFHACLARMAARARDGIAGIIASMDEEGEGERQGGSRSVEGGGECAIIRKSASLALARLLTDCQDSRCSSEMAQPRRLSPPLGGSRGSTAMLELWKRVL